MRIDTKYEIGQVVWTIESEWEEEPSERTVLGYRNTADGMWVIVRNKRGIASFVREEWLFPTIADAEAECDRRNEEVGK